MCRQMTSAPGYASRVAPRNARRRTNKYLYGIDPALSIHFTLLLYFMIFLKFALLTRNRLAAGTR